MMDKGTRKFRGVFFLPILSLVLISITSCTPVYSLKDSNSVGQVSFRFIDSRPEIEKTYRPTLAGKEIPNQPVIHRFGDENFKPDRMVIFKNYLQFFLTNILEEKTVTIKKFEVSAIMDPIGIKMDQQRVLGIASSDGMYGVALAGLIGEHIDHGNQPTDRFFLCEVEGDVDGKNFTAKGMEYFTGVFDYGSAKQDVIDAIYKTFYEAVKAIE